MTEWTDGHKKIAAVAGGVLIIIQFIEYPIYMELIGQWFSVMLSSWITAIIHVAILAALIYSYSAKEDWVTQSKDLVEDSINQTSESDELFMRMVICTECGNRLTEEINGIALCSDCTYWIEADNIHSETY